MLRDIRINYAKGSLSVADLIQDPIKQFRKWLLEAFENNQLEPTAMVLSTVDIENQPQSRVVLLKEIADDGFIFFTNYESSKGKQIATNKNVAVVFYWQSMEQQIRITGTIEKIDETTSIEYFQSRPIDSQLGAWSSPQSCTIRDYSVLENNYEFYKKKFESFIPKPPHWGGYKITPTTIEFWQGRPNRLHDRILYSKSDVNTWKIERLAP